MSFIVRLNKRIYIISTNGVIKTDQTKGTKLTRNSCSTCRGYLINGPNVDVCFAFSNGAYEIRKVLTLSEPGVSAHWFNPARSLFATKFGVHVDRYNRGLEFYPMTGRKTIIPHKSGFYVHVNDGTLYFCDNSGMSLQGVGVDEIYGSSMYCFIRSGNSLHMNDFQNEVPIEGNLVNVCSDHTVSVIITSEHTYLQDPKIGDFRIADFQATKLWACGSSVILMQTDQGYKFHSNLDERYIDRDTCLDTAKIPTGMRQALCCSGMICYVTDKQAHLVVSESETKVFDM